MDGSHRGRDGPGRRGIGELAAAARWRAREVARRSRAKVLIGRQGWLFLQNDANDVIGQHTGRVRFSPRQLEEWSALIAGRMELAGELGSIWLCSIAPDKEAVYSEFLPAAITPAERRPVHDILDAAAALGAPVSYPLDELRAAKAKARGARAGNLPVYARTDTHWTTLGALVAYEAICRALAAAGAEVPVLSRESIELRLWRMPGDLGSKLEPPHSGRGVRARVSGQRSRLVFDNRLVGHGTAMAFERDDGEGPSAVVFGESFALPMLIFLKESFRRMVFVHTSTMSREILEWERPDVVVSCLTERFMLRVPSDVDALAQIQGAMRAKREAGRALRRRVVWYLQGIPGAARARNDNELPWPIPAP